MARQKLKPCPLCGTRAGVTRLGHRNGDVVFNIACGVRDDCNDTCGLVLYGAAGVSREEMVEKWNTRATTEEPTE